MIITEVKTIVNNVMANVSSLKYAHYTPVKEITVFPALIAIEYAMEMHKIAVNGQIYNATMRIDFEIFANADMDEDDFETLTDSVITQLFTASGYDHIEVSNITYGTAQYSEKYLHGLHFTVEYLKREMW